MSVILGVDVGGSTTKIIAYESKRKKLLDALQVNASDQVTSLYGAIGHLLYEQKLSFDQISKIVLTGVGAAIIDEDIYGMPTYKVAEFDAIGRGGLMLSGLGEALVVSMGTGTAFIRASHKEIRHIGGSGVGGGSLIGLASRLVNEDDISAIIQLAREGDLRNVDLFLSDISSGEIPSLPPGVTASNFGKLSSTASKADMALGLLNMVFQTVGVLAAFSCIESHCKDVVVTGSLATLGQGQEMLQCVGALYDLNFIIPDRAAFATAIGAALHYIE